jgi:hypothetical protein
VLARREKLPDQTDSRKPIIEKMRGAVRPHIATLSRVHPHRPITAGEHESLTFLIESIDALFRVIDGYDDMLEASLCKSARGQALIELHRDNPEMPALVWKAFVAGETSYLEPDAES